MRPADRLVTSTVMRIGFRKHILAISTLITIEHHKIRVERNHSGLNEHFQNASIGEKDFVSSRGVRFTPTSGCDRVPYGLSSVKELLKFISIIMCPQEPYNNSESIILLGLELMTIALEVGGRQIGNFPSLVDLVKDDVCKSLLAVCSPFKSAFSIILSCFM